MKSIVIDPVSVANKLANEKLIKELVSEHGDGAVLREQDLYKKDGEYKTWVMEYYIDYYEYYFKMLTDNHDQKLLRKLLEV